MSRAKFNELLSKVDHYDPDERFMAISDLSNELQKDNDIDSSLEKRICVAILDRLSSDSSNDVSAMSVKCLSTLMKRAKDSQVNEVCTQLSHHLLNGKEDLRDIYSIGLQTIINDCPEAMGPIIVARTTPNLIAGVSMKDDSNGKLKTDCMDVLLILLRRFGGIMGDYHRKLAEAMLRQLNSNEASVRKRATASLGHLAVSMADPLLEHTVETLLSSISKLGKTHDPKVRTLVHTIGSISRQVGDRLGRHLPQILPLLFGFMGSVDDDELQTDEANDLRETCLQAFESFVQKCPVETSPSIPKILQDAVMPFISFDPNYTYMSDDEDMDEYSDDESFDDSGDEASGEEYDDDTSWKVRRAAIKVLVAMVRCHPEQLSTIFAIAGNQIIDRFKEREESVQLDILLCFGAFVAAAGSDESVLRGTEGATVAQVVKILSNKPGSKQKSKIGVLKLLQEYAQHIGTPLAPHLKEVLPPTLACLSEKNASIRHQALQCLNALLTVVRPDSIRDVLPKLVPTVMACVDDDWYRITAETLRIVGRLAVTLRPTTEEGKVDTQSVDASPYVRMMYAAVTPRLSGPVDQDVKEAAIEAIGLVIARLGDLLAGVLPEVLKVLVDLLRNESTRLPTIKALTVAAQSLLRIDLSSVLADVVVELGLFLRQHSRALRQASLVLLNSLLSDPEAASLNTDVLAPIMREASRMISDNDLQLCHLSLEVCDRIVQSSPAGGDLVVEHSLARMLEVAASNLTQGVALASLRQLFKSLAGSKTKGAEFSTLLAALYSASEADTAGSRQSLLHTAKCVAALCSAASPDDCAKVVRRILGDINGSGDDRTQALHLLCVGEIGRVVDVNAIDAGCFDVILKQFRADSDIIKSAAALALGGVCGGSLEVGLDIIRSALATNDITYLVLSSLKEVVVQYVPRPSSFTGHVPAVLGWLESSCESKEEGVRNMAAECLGKLAAIAPAVVFPRLVELCSAASAYSRWSVVTAIKYATTSASATSQITANLPAFARCLQDEDLDVRRAALLTVNALVHHDVRLVQSLFTDSDGPEEAEGKAAESKVADELDLLATLFQEMIPRDDLIREMDYGPFKKKVDDGLPLRKAAFACIDGILEFAPGVVPAEQLMPRICGALSDKDDVQVQCHQLIIKLCAQRLWQQPIVAQLADITAGLERVIVKFEKSRGKKQESVDLVRSCLRVIDALSKLRDSQSVKRFSDLVHRVTTREPLASMLVAVRTEQTARAQPAATSGAGAGAGAGSR